MTAHSLFGLNYQHVVRRPYPTDMELRSGWLSRAELPLAQQLQHVTAQSSGQCAASGQATPSQGQAAGTCIVFSGRSKIYNALIFSCLGQFSWSAGGEVVMGVGGGAPPVPIDTGRGMGDEVEVMSTDSSSSSSTDSN